MEFSCVRNRCTMRSFELITTSLLPLTHVENALPHTGVRSIARENSLVPEQARGPAWMAGRLRFLVAGAAVPLLLGVTGLQGGEDFAREVLITREEPSDRRWEVTLETAGLFGVRNPNYYVIAPQLLSLAWQPFPNGKSAQCASEDKSSQRSSERRYCMAPKVTL